MYHPSMSSDEWKDTADKEFVRFQMFSVKQKRNSIKNYIMEARFLDF
jgi:hypothetical protein